MTRIDEIVSNALAGIEETEVAILARELLKTREALALAQQAKGDAEGRAALADRRALGMKPHVFAAMVNSVRDLARQYGHMEQFRCRVADLLGKYIHVEHNSKGVPEEEKEVCAWDHGVPWTDSDERHYLTSCGQEFMFEDGTLEDNGFKFCHHCGKRVVDISPLRANQGGTAT